VKWFKPMFLTGAMALVTWGVWHTLTQPPHSHPGDGQADNTTNSWGSEPGRPGEGSARGSGPSGTQDAVAPLAGHEASRASLDPFSAAAGAAASVGTVAIDPGPPLPGSRDFVREGTAPRVGAAPLAGQSQKEPATPLEAQRLNDQFDALMKRVKDLRAKRQLAPAYEELSSWYGRIDELALGRPGQLLKELDELAWEVLYSPNSHLAPAYTVAPSDTLLRIATPLGVPPELLVKINGIARPDQLQPGQQIKVVHGPFHAELRLSKFELTMLVGNKKLYGGRFRIGVGKEAPQQPGTYTVVKKKMFPDYYPDPNNRERKIPGGDPYNALGTRLIVFVSADGKHDGALHGTIEPTTIGSPCNEGAIRLAREDIENVYDMLVENESKIIVRN